MTANFSIKIKEKTLQKIKKAKEEMGFGAKKWDDWFEELLTDESEKESDKEIIERIFRKNALEFWNENWIRNFALNLNNIWNGYSARELYPKNKKSNEKSSALVIGRGPSIKKHNHLELLSNSDYKGAIICSDGILPNVLEAGITPKKFNLYVLTIDAQETQKKWYESSLSQKYGYGINCILSTTAHPAVFEKAKKAGMKIFWLNTLVDYDEGKTTFNQIQGIMTKAKNHEKGLPAIQTGGNVGTSAWMVAWSILKCSHVAMIGIDQGYDSETPLDKINYHGNPFPKDIDQNSEAFKKAYPTIYNPEFDCYCKQDPLFVYYGNALKEFIQRTKDRVKTINATEGGAIFGEGVKCMQLKNFLAEYNF